MCRTIIHIYLPLHSHVRKTILVVCRLSLESLIPGHNIPHGSTSQSDLVVSLLEGYASRDNVREY